MKNNKFMHLIAVCTLLFGPLLAQAATPLEGAWLVVSWQTEDGSADAQPGLWIFNETHYSIMFINTPEPRSTYEGDQTDEHKVVAYDGFTANTGRYEVEGNILKTRAFVAKDTNFMGGWPDNETTYEFAVDGDMLTIKSVTFPVPFEATLRQVEGSAAPWASD